MAVQIPFPLPAAGFALNSKVRVNLDFIVSKFNEFNTGTATWDAVYVGTGGAINGAITFYNSTNGFYTTLQSGVATANQTYTLPTALPGASSVLMSTTGGVMSWSSGPTLGSLQLSGNLLVQGVSTHYNGIRIYNVATGYASSLTNAAGKPDAVDLAWSLPPTLGNANEVLSVDGSGHMAWGSAATLAGGATKALDNLASTAVNAHIIPDSANDTQLGSFTYPWSYVYSQRFVAGKDSVAGEIQIYPATIGKGQFYIQAADNDGANTIILTHAAQAGHRTFTIPRTDNNAGFVMDNTAQTIGGTKTFTSALVSNSATNQLVLGGVGGATKVTISATAPAGEDRVYTIPDAGAPANFLLSQGAQSVHGDMTFAAGHNIILTDDTTNTVTLALPAAVTSYTLTLPTTDGDANQILKTDGSGNTSWTDVSGISGANNTLSNLADTVAINKNLNNFSAGTITAALTGAASANVLKAGDTMTGNLQLNSKNIVFYAALGGYKQIAIPNDAVNYTLTLPSNVSTANHALITTDSANTLGWSAVILPAAHGTINQVLVDSDGAGTLGWATISGANTALSNLAVVAVNTSIISDAHNTDDLGSNTKQWKEIQGVGLYAGNAGTQAGTVYVFPGSVDKGYVTLTTTANAGNTITNLNAAAQAGARTYTIPDAGASASFVMTEGTQTINGAKTFGSVITLPAGSAAAPSVAFTGSTDKGIYSVSTRIGFSTAGTQRVRVGADGIIIDSGVLLSTTGTAAAPAMSFSSDDNNGMFLSAADALGFSTAGTERLTISSAGEITQPSQPSFLVTDGTGASDVTGDATEYTALWPTEVYDQGADFASNTFTAPVTGRYLLAANVVLQNVLVTHIQTRISIVTSNRSYRNYEEAVLARNYFHTSLTVIADMDAGDTAVVKIAVGGGTKTIDIWNEAPNNTFSGSLIN